MTPGDLGVAIDLPKLPRRLPKPLQADEVERMTMQRSAGVNEPQLRDLALVAFLVSTGCRISERCSWTAPTGTGSAWSSAARVTSSAPR